MKFEDFLDELRQDPEYVAAEEELRPLFEIANAVLRLRLAKGWSQSELARRAGTRQANISKLENGMADPTLSFLRRVAQALETDLTICFSAQQSHLPEEQEKRSRRQKMNLEASTLIVTQSRLEAKE